MTPAPTAPFPGTMRPFGQLADLDLDFTQPDRPALVTGVLAHCCSPADPAFWWDRPVGQRTAALLRVAALTDSRAHLPLHARCTAPGCGEPFSFDLPLGALRDDAPAVGPVQVQLDGGRSVRLRRPTGADLRTWRALAPATAAAATQCMLDTLLLDGDAGLADEAALSAALNALDPLVDFTVACACPACGAANDVSLDLEALALGRLAARQAALVDEVHQCATHYGWTEATVLAIPPARRARYLALIAGQA